MPDKYHSMKYTYMKDIAIILISSMLILSCSKPDKTAELEKLKGQSTELATKIKNLEEEIAKENPKAETIRAKDVGVTALSIRPFDHFVETQGSIYSKDNILVSAKSAGSITQVYVVEGDQVTQGQVLAQIDNSLFSRNIEEVKSSLALANTVYERQKNLWDQKIGTEVQYLQAKNNKENLEKRLATINEQVDQTRIKSPINGTVDDVRLRVGENISPGMPAIRIVSINNLKVIANFSESFVATVKKGNKVLVSFPDLKKEIEAKVSFVGRSIDPLSRTFPVEINLPSESDLRPNMTALIKVVFESYPKALVIPVNVIQSINNESIVYVAETTGDKTVARKKVITTNGVYGNLAQVTNGLTAGDQLITTGYQGLNDGEAIKI